jgi:hypothetical protein
MLLALSASFLVALAVLPVQAQFDSTRSSGAWAPIVPPGPTYTPQGGYPVPVAPNVWNPYYNPYNNPYAQPYYGAPIGPLVPYQWSAVRPLNLGNAIFSARLGNNISINFWRAPSGYCYPWMPVAGVLPVYNQVLYYGTGSSEPQAKQPSIATQLNDTFKFLDDMKADKTISEADYKSLRQRTTDIQRKEKSYRISQGGELDAGLEAEIRQNLEALGREIGSRGQF